MEGNPHTKPKLLYIVAEDWFFVTHFLPMARAARGAGFEVVVATRVSGHAQAIKSEGFRLVSLSIDRSSFGLTSLLSTVRRLRSILIQEKPAIVHAIAVKSVVLAGGAMLLRGRAAAVFSLTGLGYLWSGNRLGLKTSRGVTRLLLRIISLRNHAVFTFENKDDAAEFPTLPNKIVIGGWGLDREATDPKRDAFDRPSVVVIYLGRMLKAKGVEQVVEAVQQARGSVDVRLELWGTPDPGNLTSLLEEDLLELSTHDGIEWHGHATEAFSTWHRGDIAILLSEREGMPRSLIEAAAAGMPLVAYDVPGCRSIVRDGVNGFLIPVGDVAAVADALIKLTNDRDLRMRMGSAARTDFEHRFSIESVVPKIIKIYFRLVSPTDIN